MITSILAIFKMIKVLVMAHKSTLVVKNMKVNGKMIRGMVMVHVFILMVISM